MLTPGQLKIREIVPEFFEFYQQLRKVPPHDSRWYEVSQKMVKRFQNEALITSDTITGQFLRRSTPLRYVNSRWKIVENAKIQSISFENFNGQIKFDRFAYCNPSDDGPAYLCGCKPGTTCKALLSFAFEGQTFELELDSKAKYYSKAGILAPSDTSNHRLLACVLWGKLAIRKTDIEIYLEEIGDNLPLFNAAKVMDVLQFNEGSILPSLPEIETIERQCDFLLSLNKEEIIQIRQFMKAQIIDNFDYVAALVSEYRNIHHEFFFFLRWWKIINASKGVKYYMESINNNTILDKKLRSL